MTQNNWFQQMDYQPDFRPLHGHGVDQVPADDEELWLWLQFVENFHALFTQFDLLLPRDVRVLLSDPTVAIVGNEA